jgi:hypothetical protein
MARHLPSKQVYAGSIPVARSRKFRTSVPRMQYRGRKDDSMKKNYDHLSVTETSQTIEIRGQMKRPGGLGFWAALTPHEAFELWYLLGRTFVVQGMERLAVKRLLRWKK